MAQIGGFFGPTLKEAKDCIDGEKRLLLERSWTALIGWRNRRGQISWINLIAMDAPGRSI